MQTIRTTYSNLLKCSIFFLFSVFSCLSLAESTTGSSKEINMVYYRENAEEFLKTNLAIFEKTTGYKVNLVFVSIHDLKQLLVKAAYKDSLPDVVLAPSDIISLAKTIKLSPIPRSLLVKEMQADAIKSVEFMGKPYGIPLMGGNHLMLYYNKNYVSTPALTWQELKAQQVDLTEKGIKTLGLNYSEMYWFTAFAGTFGGDPISDGKITLNSQAYIDALKFYKELSTSNFIFKRCGYDCVHKDFIAEKYAYSINGEWAFNDFEKALGDKLGIALVPAIDGKPFRPLFSTAALLFTGNSLAGPKKKALSKLSQFLQSKEIQDAMSKDAQFLPIRVDSFAKLKGNASPNIKMLLKQLSLAKPMSADAMMSSAWAGMQKGWARYMSGVLSAKDAAIYMQTFAERDYKKSQVNNE